MSPCPMPLSQIDIGGPTLVRAAAKNHQYLTILSNPDQYGPYLDAMRENQGTAPLEFRQACARAAFWHTAAYDQAIATYLTQQTAQKMPLCLSSGRLPAISRLPCATAKTPPHQTAAWYRTGSMPTGWAGADKLQGKRAELQQPGGSGSRPPHYRRISPLRHQQRRCLSTPTPAASAWATAWPKLITGPMKQIRSRPLAVLW